MSINKVLYGTHPTLGIECSSEGLVQYHKQYDLLRKQGESNARS